MKIQGILTKEQFNENLYKYYVEHYGERETDEWFDKPAVNVIVFRRGEEYISLKSDIRTGEVTEYIERSTKK